MHRAGLTLRSRLLWLQACGGLLSRQLAAGVACSPLQQPLQQIMQLVAGIAPPLTVLRALDLTTVSAGTLTATSWRMLLQRHLQAERPVVVVYQLLLSIRRLQHASLCTRLQAHQMLSVRPALRWSCCTVIGASELRNCAKRSDSPRVRSALS